MLRLIITSLAETSFHISAGAVLYLPSSFIVLLPVLSSSYAGSTFPGVAALASFRGLPWRLRHNLFVAKAMVELAVEPLAPLDQMWEPFGHKHRWSGERLKPFLSLSHGPLSCTTSYHRVCWEHLASVLSYLAPDNRLWPVAT